MKYDISIIVPIYNSEKTLEKCINSIVTQKDFSKMQLLLIDDGSLDGSKMICDRYLSKYNNIQLVSRENRGANYSRKEAFQLTEGKYIGFVDSDDWISEDMFSGMYHKAEETNCDVVICSYYEEGLICKENKLKYDGLYDKEKLKKMIYPSLIADGTFFGCAVDGALWNKLFKRELLEKYIMSSDDLLVMGEDKAILVPSILQANLVCFMSEFFGYHYFIQDNSISRSYKQDFFEKCKRWKKYMLNICADFEEDYTSQIDIYFIALVVSSVINECRFKLSESKNILTQVVNDEEVVNSIQRIDYSRFHFRAKIITLLIKRKQVALLRLLFKIKEKE